MFPQTTSAQRSLRDTGFKQLLDVRPLAVYLYKHDDARGIYRHAAGTGKKGEAQRWGFSGTLPG
jgi:hypothetical protein